MSQDEIKHIFERSCLRKAQLSENDANCIIDFHLETDGLLLYYYKCPFCNSIHLTKQVPQDETRVEVI